MQPNTYGYYETLWYGDPIVASPWHGPKGEKNTVHYFESVEGKKTGYFSSLEDKERGRVKKTNMAQKH